MDVEQTFAIRPLWPVLQPGAESRYFSSFDRTGGNDDGFRGTYSALYVDERGEHVIFDAEGPGCLRTLWFTSESGGYDRLSAGIVRFYFDGEEVPRLELEANEIFSGKAAPFVRPLVADNRISTGGFVSWVPLPYRGSLKITTENRAFFYIAQYDTFAVDAELPTWTPGMDLSSAHRAFSDASAPSPECVPVDLVCERRGSGVIDCIRFTPAGELPDEAHIRIWWDGRKEPAVDCPLRMFCGSGLPTAGLNALAFSIQGGVYENRLPMPYWSGFRIEVSEAMGQLALATSRQRYDPRTAGQLHVSYRKEHPTTLGQDFTMLETARAGKLVGTVLLVEPPTALDKGWWEGDLRSSTNGKRTPGMHGTGHEDDHLGGWSNEFLDTPFSLPMHGEPAVEMLDREGQYNGNCSLYRLWPGINFLDGISHSVEHGNENVENYNYSSATFWYAHPGWSLVQTDQLLPCDEASRAAHAVAARNESEGSELTSTFEGRGCREPFTLRHRSHLSRLSFTASLHPDNQGVLLRRVYDQFHGRQRARVLVDGEYAATWYTPEENRHCRWAEREIFIPARFVAGKQRVEIAIDPPASTPLWDAAEYRVFCVLGP